MLEMFTMLAVSFCANASPKICVGMIVPHRLRSITYRSPSMFMLKMSSSGCTTPCGMLPPAAFTRPSILPKKANALSFAAISCSSFSTSATSASAEPPAALIAAALSSATFSFRPRMPTAPPQATMASMNAPPNIPVPPVTTTTFPVRSESPCLFIFIYFWLLISLFVPVL